MHSLRKLLKNLNTNKKGVVTKNKTTVLNNGMTPQNGLFMDEDGRIYSLIDLIKNIKINNVGGTNDTLVTTEIVDGTLTLTTDKYQTTTMKNNTTIVLPQVDKFTEIHLFFSVTEDLTLTLPKVTWQNEPTIESGKTYEFIFTYTTEYLGGCICYDSKTVNE